MNRVAKHAMLTLAALVLFVILEVVFKDKAFDTNALWDSHDFGAGTIWAYTLAVAIVVIGFLQYRTGKDVTPAPYLFLAVRFFAGLAWIGAGVHKAMDALWRSGEGMVGFVTGATTIPEGAEVARGDYYGWYGEFLRSILDNGWQGVFGPMVAFGEVAVGLGLIFGVLTPFAAAGGVTMNWAFIAAGTASSNGTLLLFSAPMVIEKLYGNKASYFGLQRVALDYLHKEKQAEPVEAPVVKPASRAYADD